MGESFQKLNLTNAYLFAAALQDEEICRNLLEIVLNKEIPRVKAHAEHTLFLDSDFKSVRFDVYASDEKIRNIHERVKYLKRDRKLEAGYMTMEEYIREEAERRAKLIAPSIAESMAESMAETLAESMAETLAKPMAESLAASKVAQSILSLAAELGTIPAEEQQRIAGEQDDETLEKWLKLAARSTTVEEFLSGM